MFCGLLYSKDKKKDFLDLKLGAKLPSKMPATSLRDTSITCNRYGVPAQTIAHVGKLNK
jgi:hypothetical protein